MRNRIQLGLAVVCLTAIPFGFQYTSGRDRRRDADLLPLYQQINRESFAGKLPPVSVSWANLPEAYGDTRTSEKGSTDVLISRQIVKTPSDLEFTMRHESCHVFARAVVEETNQDAHGPAFEDCMKRFN